ncbi:MAG: hypothetical protein QM775_14745 [Pirellulales bacterium]
MAALSAAAAFALNQQFQMSGEWFVGGIEAKVPAYALVFYGLADVFQGALESRPRRLGRGGGISRARRRLVARRRRHGMACRPAAAGASFDPSRLGRRRAAFARRRVARFGGFSAGVDSATLAEADQLYVFRRLAHHLWAVDFFPKFAARHLLLIVGWLVVCGTMPSSPQDKRLRWFVAAAIALAWSERSFRMLRRLLRTGPRGC